MTRALFAAGGSLLLALWACNDEGPCATKGARRDQRHICVCPDGMHTRGNRCEPDDAGTGFSASTASDAGSTIGLSPMDASGPDAGRDAVAPVAPPPPVDRPDDAGQVADTGQPADTGPLADTGAPGGAVQLDAAVVDAGPPPPSCIAVPEDCDGKDNDCDGIIDNGVKNECGACGKLVHAKGEACSNGGQGPCAKPGAYQCMGETTVCNAPPASPSTEICDNVDNDCDGVVDDGITKNACQGCAPLAQTKGAACSDGVGECRVTGTWECVGTEAVACTAKARAAGTESCDGKDNDCDGQVDEEAGPDAPLWYQDCDGDTYAPTTEGAIRSCVRPASGCGWTRTRPDELNKVNWDCNDGFREYRPGADYSLRPAKATSFDMNCDGAVEPSAVAPTGVKICTSSYVNWYQRAQQCRGAPCQPYIAEDRCKAFLWGSPPVDERTTTYQVPETYACPDTAVTMFTSCYTDSGETVCQAVKQSGGWEVIWPCK